MVEGEKSFFRLIGPHIEESRVRILVGCAAGMFGYPRSAEFVGECERDSECFFIRCLESNGDKIA